MSVGGRGGPRVVVAGGGRSRAHRAGRRRVWGGPEAHAGRGVEWTEAIGAIVASAARAAALMVTARRAHVAFGRTVGTAMSATTNMKLQEAEWIDVQRCMHSEGALKIEDHLVPGFEGHGAMPVPVLNKKRTKAFIRNLSCTDQSVHDHIVLNILALNHQHSKHTSLFGAGLKKLNLKGRYKLMDQATRQQYDQILEFAKMAHASAASSSVER